MVFRVAELFGINPFRLSDEMTEEQIRLAVNYVRLRMAEHDQELEIKLKAGGFA